MSAAWPVESTAATAARSSADISGPLEADRAVRELDAREDPRAVGDHVVGADGYALAEHREPGDVRVVADADAAADDAVAERAVRADLGAAHDHRALDDRVRPDLDAGLEDHA